MADPLPVSNWRIRLEWSRECGASLSIIGRANVRSELEEFIRDLELANSLLASAIEAASAVETGNTGSTEGESAARKGTPKAPQESNQ